jgi:hypothetical protein
MAEVQSEGIKSDYRALTSQTIHPIEQQSTFFPLEIILQNLAHYPQTHAPDRLDRSNHIVHPDSSSPSILSIV